MLIVQLSRTLTLLTLLASPLLPSLPLETRSIPSSLKDPAEVATRPDTLVPTDSSGRACAIGVASRRRKLPSSFDDCQNDKERTDMSGRAENEAGKKRWETHPQLKSSDQIPIFRPSRLAGTPNQIVLTESASLRRALDAG